MASDVSEIVVTKLDRISLKGGDVLKVMNKHQATFNGFGEAYFSLIENGVRKGVKRHLQMTMNLTVPIGLVEFAFRDENGGNRLETIGESNYCRLTVPNKIWFSFSGLATPLSLVLNIADIDHDPREVERKPLDYFGI
jgi:dTDP-4-dehydrorhamnose 3,5-epimerase